MPKKQAAAETPFDLSGVRRAPRYMRKELEREGEKPLWVKVQRLTIAQVTDIPFGAKVTLKDGFEAIAPYVVEWNLTAQDRQTGKDKPVPPPADFGPEVLELLDYEEAGWLYNLMKFGHLQRDDDEKKDSKPSAPTPTPSPATSRADA